MPDLLPPKVVGEISTLNTYVIVENQQAGTTLAIAAVHSRTAGHRSEFRTAVAALQHARFAKRRE